MNLRRIPIILFLALGLGGCTTAVKDRKPPAPAVTTERFPKTGVADFSAQWGDYGAYLKELSGIVQAQWYKILNESHASVPRRTSVTVKFRLNSEGEVEILRVDDAGAGKQGVSCCLNALTFSMPYRKWTDPMIAALGHAQELTFTFEYQ
jgi:hypothetical protein